MSRSPAFDRIAPASARRVAPSLGARSILLALGLAAFSLGCATPAAEVAQIPHPDLSAMEAPVQERLEQLRAAAEEPADGSPEGRARAWGNLGRAYMAYVFNQAAEACFDHAADLEPERPDWSYYLGILRQERGDLEAAVSSFEHAATTPIDGAGERLAALIRLGRARLELGQGQAAQEAFTEALGLDPSSSAALAGSGRAAAAEGDPARAVELYRQALAGLPDDTSVHQALGQALRQAGRADEARAHLEREASRPVAFPDPWLDEVGRILHQTALAVVLEQAADPSIPVDDFLGFALSKLGKVEGAAEVVEQEIERLRAPSGEEPALASAGLARLHYVAGALLIEAGKPWRAAQQLEAAVALEPEFTEANLRLGSALGSIRHFPKALGAYSRVLKVEPDHPEALLGLGSARVDLGRYQRALIPIRRLLEIEPGNGRALLRMARAYDGLGRESLPQWQAALELELPDRERAFAWFSLGNRLIHNGRPEEAVDAYRSALEIEPTSTGTWLNLAHLLDKLGRPDEAAAARARLEELQR